MSRSVITQWTISEAVWPIEHAGDRICACSWLLNGSNPVTCPSLLATAAWKGRTLQAIRGGCEGALKTSQRKWMNQRFQTTSVVKGSGKALIASFGYWFLVMFQWTVHVCGFKRAASFTRGSADRSEHIGCTHTLTPVFTHETLQTHWGLHTLWWPEVLIWF